VIPSCDDCRGARRLDESNEGLALVPVRQRRPFWLDAK